MYCVVGFFDGFFDGYQLTAYNVTVLYRKGNSISQRIDAKNMKWVDNNWVFQGVIKRLFNNNEKMEKLAKLSGLELNVKPEDLSIIQIKPEEMNYAELKKFINKLKSLGGDATGWSVNLYQKLSFPFSNFIIVLFGIAFASTGWRGGGAAKGYAISLLICFLYYGINVSMGPILGQKGLLHPALAAWLGNIIFGTFGVIVLVKTPK